MLLISLYLPCLLPLSTLIIGYGKTMTQAACLILDMMNLDPPNPIVPAMKIMSRTTRGLEWYGNSLMKWLKRTYLLLLLFQVLMSTLSKPCCLQTELNDPAVHLMPFDNMSETIVALHNSTNHIFSNETDFHRGIISMDPIKVTGL